MTKWHLVTMHQARDLLATAVILIAVFCPKEVIGRGFHHRHGAIPGCSRCPPGSVVIRHCGHGHDTECTPCRPGSYISHHTYKRQCYPCSRCGEGLYVAHPCTDTRDTVCDSCHTFKGPHNEDFYRKCQVPAKTAILYDNEDSKESENSIEDIALYKSSTTTTTASSPISTDPNLQNQELYEFWKWNNDEAEDQTSVHTLVTPAPQVAREMQPLTAKEIGFTEYRSRDEPPIGPRRHTHLAKAFVAMVIGVAGLTVVMVATLVAITRWKGAPPTKDSKSPRCSYEAVSTEDAVLL